ncbi:hypothetical protein M8J76_000650 [Diaphorina citri]|nr:hypothetical protein M8J76_000650 [Diaphorina citri]
MDKEVEEEDKKEEEEDKEEEEEQENDKKEEEEEKFSPEELVITFFRRRQLSRFDTFDGPTLSFARGGGTESGGGVTRGPTIGIWEGALEDEGLF